MAKQEQERPVYETVRSIHCERVRWRLAHRRSDLPRRFVATQGHAIVNGFCAAIRHVAPRMVSR